MKLEKLGEIVDVDTNEVKERIEKMARNIDIEIIGNDWYIEDYEEERSNKDESFNFFAHSYTNGNVIVYLHDYLAVELTDEIKKDKRFLEVCNFKHGDKNFDGTFLDALEYIKEELKNERT